MADEKWDPLAFFQRADFRWVERFDASDGGIAEHIIEVLAEEAPGTLVRDRGEYRYHNLFRSGPGWHQISDESMSAIIAAFHGKVVQTGVDEEGRPTYVRIKMTGGRMRSIRDLLCARTTQMGFFDDAQSGAAFSNCLVHATESGQIVLVPHKPEHRTYAEHLRDYAFQRFDPGTKFNCPRFKAMIRQWWGSGPEAVAKARFFLQYIGTALLMEAYRYRINPILLGPKGTGKSTLLRIVEDLWPAGAASSVPFHQMSQQFGAQQLIHAQINIVTELSDQPIPDAARVKGMMTGDKTQVDQKYKAPVLFRPKMGHIVAANPPLPPVADAALRDRFVIIAFNRVLKKKDPMAYERVREEIPEITRWALSVAISGPFKRGLGHATFDIPESSRLADRDWREDSDSVGAWMETNTKPGGFTPVDDLFSDYKLFCATDDQRPVTRVWFGRQLQRYGVRQCRPRKKDGSRLRGYELTLKD